MKGRQVANWMEDGNPDSVYPRWLLTPDWMEIWNPFSVSSLPRWLAGWMEGGDPFYVYPLVIGLFGSALYVSALYPMIWSFGRPVLFVLTIFVYGLLILVWCRTIWSR